jgi:cytidine deaminase
VKEQATEARIKELIEKCLEIRKNAYAPYSGFAVGAVLVDHAGREFSGVNVENASFGLTVCAERNAVAAAVAGGMKQIKLLCVAADAPAPVTPCGACRQVIAEFADEDAVIIAANLDKNYKLYKVSDLLPEGFKLKP